MPECSTCGGPLVEMGALGNLMHYRCRNCGLEYHEPIPVEPEEVDRPEFPIYVGWDGREHGEF
jgi:tRNA(Ile2) C34 agmatinyltransferase TiaS